MTKGIVAIRARIIELAALMGDPNDSAIALGAMIESKKVVVTWEELRALLAQHDADQGRIEALEGALDDIIEAQRLLAAEDENTTPYQLGAIRAWEIVAQIARRAREGGE